MAAETLGEKTEKTKKLFWRKLFFLAAGLGIRYAVKNFTDKIRERREEKERSTATT